MYSNFIESILEKSSEIATNYFGKVKGTVKKDDSNQVLTKADLEIGKYIINRIKEKYPRHNIIDEESGITDNNSSYTWVIDPIDGTSNFANGVPNYGIIVGLLKGDKPLAGGVSLPFFEEIIIAQTNKGTYCNNTKLHVGKEKKLINTLVAYAIDGHQEKPSITEEECNTLSKIILRIRNLRASGSVVDGIMVARGKYGGYLNRTSKIWDNVGQQIIIEEAGGKYTDFFGKTMDYSKPLSKANDNFTWCMASPQIHKQLQKIIHCID
ncbi:MAG: inositol monophosphatase [Candidatus Delongbacteria bacterium]|nr:inositol monophosphatase [Candidatus Delongbacteria bacterium]